MPHIPPAAAAECDVFASAKVPVALDFPGTIDIRMEHLLDFMLDNTKSVAHHGFKRILIADGHGSNTPILDLVARRTNLETNPERVQIEKAKPDMDLPASEFIWMDLMEGSRVLLMDEWTRFSKSGVYGDRSRRRSLLALGAQVQKPPSRRKDGLA